MPTSHLKTVVVTGAASGIGLESCKALLETGDYRVAMMARDGDKLTEAARGLAEGLPANIKAQRDLITTYACDFRDSASVRKASEKILAVHGQTLYGLVNNAGIYPFGGVATTTDAQWDETLAIHLKAPFALIQMLSPAMAKGPHGGRIVNVSSTAGILPNHFALAYSVSKAALVHLTKTLAKELGKDNITVNCVCPGIVRSPLHEAYHRSQNELEEFYNKRGAAFPMGRVGEPKDVASAIQFFLSDAASWVTGDIFVIDGGRLLM